VGTAQPAWAQSVEPPDPPEELPPATAEVVGLKAAEHDPERGASPQAVPKPAAKGPRLRSFVYGTLRDVGEGALEFLGHWFGAMRLQHLNPFDDEDGDEDMIRHKAVLDLSAKTKSRNPRDAIRSNFTTVKRPKEVEKQLKGKGVITKVPNPKARRYKQHLQRRKHRGQSGKQTLRLGNQVIKRAHVDNAENVQFIDTSLYFHVSGAIFSVRFHVGQVNPAGIKFQVYRHHRGTEYTLIGETIPITSEVAGVDQIFKLVSPLCVEAGDFLGWAHEGAGSICFDLIKDGGNLVHWREGLEPVGSKVDFSQGWSRRTYSYEVVYVEDMLIIGGKPQGWPNMGWGGPPIIIDREEDEFAAAIEQEDTVLERQYYPVFICGQCVVCFFLWLIFRLKDGTAEAGLESLWPEETDLAVQWDCVDFRSEVWRWWTYQYTHIGWGHIGFNVLLTLFYGISLEGMHGFWRMLVMFQVGVFGGACCYMVFDVHTRVVGMSGGVYALLGMQFGDIFMNYSEQKKAAKRFNELSDEDRQGLENLYTKGIFSPILKIAVLLVLTAVDILQAFLFDNQTSHAAHVGGAVSGFLVAIVVGHNQVWRDWEVYFWRASIVAGIVLIIFCLAWGLSWPPQEFLEQVRWCWARQVNNATIFGDSDWHCVRCGNDECIASWSLQENIATVSASYCNSDLGGWAYTES